jgi:hypothetical protein
MIQVHKRGVLIAGGAAVGVALVLLLVRRARKVSSNTTPTLAELLEEAEQRAIKADVVSVGVVFDI